MIMTLLYRKSLRLSNAARQESSVGQIVNLMSNDANRFPEFSMFVSHSHLCSASEDRSQNALLSAAQWFWQRLFLSRPLARPHRFWPRPFPPRLPPLPRF